MTRFISLSMPWRRMPVRSLLLSLATLGAASGCSNSPAGVPIEELSHELAQAYCDQLVSCGSAHRFNGSPSYWTESPSFAEVCPNVFAPGFGSVDHLEAAIEAGTLAYDAQAARQCITDHTTGCVSEGGLGLFPSCREALRGLVPLGGSCTLSEECEPGSRCTAELLMNACTAGECVARSPLGALCSESDECVHPEGAGITLCTTNGGTDRVCQVAALTLGAVEDEPCGDLGDSGLERDYAVCAADFFCDDPDYDGAGTCQPPLATGAVCTLGQACEQGSLCLPAVMQRVCTRVTIATATGEACDDVVTVCDETARLVCVAGQCAAMDPGLCAGSMHCENDQYCEISSGTCETRKPNGAECGSWIECINDGCADDGTMTGTYRCVDRVYCG
jgi:hypothetical protein